MKGYWIVLGTPVTDAEAQTAYGALWEPIGRKYDARLIARGAPPDLREGSGIARALIVEFPSVAMARACYDDPDYQQAKALAQAASGRTLVILEGNIA